MSLRERLYALAGQRFFERPAEKLSFAEHFAALSASGQAIRERLSRLRPTERHREVLRHVIGIERWGQRRLRVLLGEPFVLDGHEAYKPAAAEPWERLLEEFARTRAETVGLAERLNDCTAHGRVPHNQFGELSARGWLRYLKGHAEVETKRLR